MHPPLVVNELYNELYVDGGVIDVNPSPVGGTWAFRVLRDGQVLTERAGTISPRQAGLSRVSNNLTEMLAMLNGLSMLPEAWQGTIYSDSQVTIGRVSMGWKWNNIPAWMNHVYQRERRRLSYWDTFTFVLLDGHPTKAQLLAGVGKRGHPVSEHNVWCDSACQKMALEFKRVLGEVGAA